MQPRIAFAAVSAALLLALCALLSPSSSSSSSSSSSLFSALHMWQQGRTAAGLSHLQKHFISSAVPPDMRSLINASADPCASMYDFACGLWDPAVPEFKSSQSHSWDGVESLVTQRLRGILELDPGKAGTYFRACMDLPSIEEEGIKPFAAWNNIIANELDGTKSGLARILGKFHSNQISVGFKIDTRLDDAESRETFMLKAGGMLMPTEAHYLDDAYQGDRVKYLTLGAEMLEAAGYSNAAHLMQMAYDVEYRIASFDNSEEAAAYTGYDGSVDPSDTETGFVCKKKLAKLDELKDVISKDLDWRAYVEVLTKDSGSEDLHIPWDDVTFLCYCPKIVNHILQRLLHNSTAAQAYFTWHLVVDSAPVMNEKLYSLSVALNQMFSNAGPPRNPPRWNKCAKAAANAIPMEVSRVYISKFLNEDMIQSAFAVVARVHRALRDLLQRVPWMQEETREKAVDKVMKMRTEVAIPSDATEALLEYGFELTPHYYINAFRASQAKIRLMLNVLCLPNQKSVSRVHWSMAPTEANSYYDPTLNTLFITAAMLSPPFFDMKYSIPRLYGGLGWIVGHEACHGFDNTGHRYDGAGHASAWWNAVDEAKFAQRAKCIADLYGSYELYGKRVDGNLTLGEDIADVGGLDISHVAFERAVKERYMRPPTQLEQQIFFTAAAQNWCMKEKQKEALLDIATDEHAPERVRVDAAMSQLRVFADAFGCREGEKMNPKQRCDMW